MLAGSMSLLRRCRVNAALTIQLFSWLFHHVNMWLFNSLLAGSSPCNRQTGSLLKRRLAHLVAWAEKQGLELAADCHLARIIQASPPPGTRGAALSAGDSENLLQLYRACRGALFCNFGEGKLFSALKHPRQLAESEKLARLAKF